MEIDRQKFQDALNEAEERAKEHRKREGGSYRSHLQASVDNVIVERYNLPHDQQAAVRKRMMEDLGYAPRHEGGGVPSDFDFTGNY